MGRLTVPAPLYAFPDERAGEVFLAAQDRPAADRDAFRVGACEDDDALLRERPTN